MDGDYHEGIGDLAVGRNAGFWNIEDSVGAARHASADALAEEAKIVGQDGALDQLVGALKKLVQIHGLTGYLIDNCIGLFLGYDVLDRINIAGLDSGVATWSGGSKRVPRAQQVAVLCEPS